MFFISSTSELSLPWCQLSARGTSSLSGSAVFSAVFLVVVGDTFYWDFLLPWNSEGRHRIFNFSNFTVEQFLLVIEKEWGRKKNLRYNTGSSENAINKGVTESQKKMEWSRNLKDEEWKQRLGGQHFNILQTTFLADFSLSGSMHSFWMKKDLDHISKRKSIFKWSGGLPILIVSSGKHLHVLLYSGQFMMVQNNGRWWKWNSLGRKRWGSTWKSL